MTVVIIIDNQQSEPLDNLTVVIIYKQSTVWTTRQPWQ